MVHLQILILCPESGRGGNGVLEQDRLLDGYGG